MKSNSFFLMGGISLRRLRHYHDADQLRTIASIEANAEVPSTEQPAEKTPETTSPAPTVEWPPDGRIGPYGLATATVIFIRPKRNRRQF